MQRESAWRAEGSAEAQRASEAAAVQDQVGFPCAGARRQNRLVTEARSRAQVLARLEALERALATVVGQGLPQSTGVLPSALLVPDREGTCH